MPRRRTWTGFWRLAGRKTVTRWFPSHRLPGGFGLRGWQTSHAVASVVSLDVNPSIQLQVNQKEIVLEAQALNAEAQEILEGMDLRKTLKVVMHGDNENFEAFIMKLHAIAEAAA